MYLIHKLEVSERFACRAIGQLRTTQRYQKVNSPDRSLLLLHYVKNRVYRFISIPKFLSPGNTTEDIVSDINSLDLLGVRTPHSE